MYICVCGINRDELNPKNQNQNKPIQNENDEERKDHTFSATLFCIVCNITAELVILSALAYIPTLIHSHTHTHTNKLDKL